MPNHGAYTQSITSGSHELNEKPILNHMNVFMCMREQWAYKIRKTKNKTFFGSLFNNLNSLRQYIWREKITEQKINKSSHIYQADFFAHCKQSRMKFWVSISFFSPKIILIWSKEMRDQIKHEYNALFDLPRTYKFCVWIWS